MGATCFPAGGPDMIEPQLIDLIANTDGTLGAALAYADTELTQAMDLFRYRENQQPIAIVECGAGI